MVQIFWKEIAAFFSSLVAYVVMCVFFLGTGLIVWVFPETSILEGGFADLYPFFSLSPYIFLFLIPAVTMRSFAEEKKSGTFEMLLTFPLNEWSVILGKFFAAWFLVFFTLLPTFIYYYTVSDLSMPAGNVDSAAVFGSYIGLWLLGGVFCAFGIFSSSLTDNQIIAFIYGVFLCFLFYTGFSSLAQLDISWLSLLFMQISLNEHFTALAKGLIDSRDIFYFFSLIFFVLYLTKIVLTSRLW
jgi:ABC-2 type transport system permease protein